MRQGADTLRAGAWAHVRLLDRGCAFIGLLGTAVNSTFNYPNYFSMSPNGPEPKRSYTEGFLDVAVRQNPNLFEKPWSAA